MVRTRTPCPSCPGEMRRGSISCRACSQARIKKEFSMYFVKVKADILPHPTRRKKTKKWRTG